MEVIDILGFVGGSIIIISFFAIENIKRLYIILFAITVLLIYSILKPVAPFVLIFTGLLIYLIYRIKKTRKSSSIIKLTEVEHDNPYLEKFFKNYKKDIYSYFPFYTKHSAHKFFLIMLDMSLAGVLIGQITKDTLTIEVDYLKPVYRDYSIGNYIFNKNTGFFKKMGIKIIIGKSFHKGHTKFLKKMGFSKKYIDDQLFYVKNID